VTDHGELVIVELNRLDWRIETSDGERSEPIFDVYFVAQH